MQTVTSLRFPHDCSKLWCNCFACSHTQMGCWACSSFHLLVMGWGPFPMG